MKNILFSLLCVLFLFTACSDDDERSETATYLRIPETVKTLHYLKDIQRANIKIETNDANWTITSDKDWCDVHRISSNPEMFRLSLDENINLNQRDAQLTLKAEGFTETIAIKQLGSKPAILVNPEKFDNIPSEKTEYELVITTNVSSFTWKIPGQDKTWLSIKALEDNTTRTMVDSKYTLTVQSNTNLEKRLSTIVFVGNGDEDEHPSVELPIVQKKRSTDIEGILEKDSKILPRNSWASTEQGSQPISNSYDGFTDDTHCYHSNWFEAVQFPATLEYYFDGTQDIDYIMYYANGNNKFKEVKIYYLDGGEIDSFDQTTRPENTPSTGRNWKEIEQNYTLQNTQESQRLILPERLQNVTGIKFEVKTSYGAGVACNEMEFYHDNNSHLNALLLSVFKDITCNELNKDVTDEMISSLPGYFAQLASLMKNGNYTDWERKFRIQDYKPYSDVYEAANKMFIKKYGNQDNITGVYVEEGNEIVVLVGDTYGNNIGLQILGEETTGGDNSYVQTESPDKAHYIALVKGVNIIKAQKTGMLFVLYAADPTNPANKPIRIHIPYASGKVSGFFDLATDKTNTVYADLLSKATYKYFGVRGKEIIFFFHTSELRKVAPDKIVEAINLWDNIVGWEHEIMGYTDNNRKRYNNHVFAISPEGGYMWQSEFRVAFVYTYLENILLPENVEAVEDNAWGPAHEVGHIHQKAINWPGCSESSNNLFSNYVIYKMGKYHSRGYGLSRLAMSRYFSKAPWVTLGTGSANSEDTELHMRMYWQLFIYYHLCKGKTDFWPQVFENMRTRYGGEYTAEKITNGTVKAQMMFVEAVCDAAQENLLDFFDAWGFFTPTPSGFEVSQYGTFKYEVTEDVINETRRNIFSRGYRKAAPIQYIEDRKNDWFTSDDYRSQESGDVGYLDQFKGTAATFADDYVKATVLGNNITIDPSTGAKAVAFEVRKGSNSSGELVYFSNSFKFTAFMPNNISMSEVKLWAVQADGVRRSIKVN